MGDGSAAVVVEVVAVEEGLPRLLGPQLATLPDDSGAPSLDSSDEGPSAMIEHMPGRRRRAEMFASGEMDPRFDAPATGDERTMLVEFLQSQRATLVLKCSGLDAELSRRSVDPSTLSLLGLVRHLADVERRWSRRVMAGQSAPPCFSSDTNPDGDFDGAVPDPAVIAEAWDVWHAEVAFADRFIAGAPDLDIVGHDSWRGTVSLRWVLISHGRGVRPAQRARRSAP